MISTHAQLKLTVCSCQQSVPVPAKAVCSVCSLSTASGSKINSFFKLLDFELNLRIRVRVLSFARFSKFPVKEFKQSCPLY